MNAPQGRSDSEPAGVIERATLCTSCYHTSAAHGMSGLCLVHDCRCAMFTPPDGLVYSDGVERCVYCGEEGEFEDGLRCKRCAEEQDGE